MKTLNDNVLRGLTKPALIKTIKELYAMREEAIEYINWALEDDTGFNDSKHLILFNEDLDKLLEILQGNKEEE